MSHPWMTKGFSGPPENHLPHREPLQLPLDPKVIDKMTGFEFGTASYIQNSLEAIVSSEDYQRAIRLSQKKANSQHHEGHSKRTSMFDFYSRRKSNISKDALSDPSSEALHLGDDPVNAFNPLVSIYYLVREKQDREQQESNPGALSVPNDHPLAIGDLAPPQAAVTNTSSYEMKGEAPTGGRSRPRARTHGEDEIVESVNQQGPPATQGTPTPVIHEPATRANQLKKEGTAAGILRRLSTRRRRESDSEKERPKIRPMSASPSIIAQPPAEGAGAGPRQGLLVRKQRDRETPPSAYKDVAEKHPDLLAPPGSSDSGQGKRLKGLGRSASVNSGDVRRRWSLRKSRLENADPSKASGYESEKSSISDHRSRHSENLNEDREPVSKRLSFMGRTRSVDYSRQGGAGTRQSMRVERNRNHEQVLPEETDAELAEEFSGGMHEAESQEQLKPVYFKGLFSVSTTSSKPLAFIRSDIIRVLRQLGVDFTERKTGFNCRHLPSIDLNRVKDSDSHAADSPRISTQVHRRKISFAGLRSGERDHAERPAGTPRSMSRREHDFEHTPEESEDENADQRAGPSNRAPGETTTHVQSDLGQSMILKFEIHIVKIPIVALHGLQFKKVDGGTWQYKRMAETILSELKL